MEVLILRSHPPLPRHIRPAILLCTVVASPPDACDRERSCACEPSPGQPTSMSIQASASPVHKK